MGRKEREHKKSKRRLLRHVRVGLLLIFPLVGILVGLYRTEMMERHSNQRVFESGQVPDPLPNGFYQGNEQTGIGASWMGKLFDQTKQTGINRFNDGDRFHFKTYQSPGLRDHNTTVLKIDYNQSGNPWWLRFIVDEIVEVEPGKYLGKVHVKVLPWPTFTLMYFELSSTSQAQ